MGLPSPDCALYLLLQADDTNKKNGINIHLMFTKNESPQSEHGMPVEAFYEFDGARFNQNPRGTILKKVNSELWPCSLEFIIQNILKNRGFSNPELGILLSGIHRGRVRLVAEDRIASANSMYKFVPEVPQEQSSSGNVVECAPDLT